MVDLAKYAAMAALAVGLGVAATKPAAAWGSDPTYGYGYGAFASDYPEVYAFTYPNGYVYVMTYPGGYEESYRPYGYRLPYHRHFYGYGYRPYGFYRHRW
jgi:hypothetical protein